MEEYKSGRYHDCKWLRRIRRVSMVLRLPVLGGAQIIAFARLFETHNRSNSMTEHHIETTGFFQASSTTDGRVARVSSA